MCSNLDRQENVRIDRHIAETVLLSIDGIFNGIIEKTQLRIVTYERCNLCLQVA